MNAQLTLWPFLADSVSYGPPLAKTLADWGIESDFSGTLHGSLFPSELNLRFIGSAMTDSPFAPRSRVALALDGKTLFAGYVDNPPERAATESENSSALHCQDSLWALDRLVFRQAVQILTAVVGGQPVFDTKFYTHFKLNLQPTANFQTGIANTVFYSTTQLGSRAQIAQVLDFAKARGIWIDYNLGDILDVPVRATDVQNLSCLGAIRCQLEDVNAVCWLDFSQVAGGGAPMFHAARRQSLPSISRALSTGRALDNTTARGFKLRQLDDMGVSYVQIDFEQQVTVGSYSTPSILSVVFPNPKPADEFGALITSVPIRAQTASVHEKYIKTEPILVNDLSWWQRRIPAMDPAMNPNAGSEFEGLAFVAGSTRTRQSSLPNMIVAGGVADWMGGSTAKDVISAQFAYHRRTSAGLSGGKVSAHTRTTRVDATDLNFPDGQLFRTLDWSSTGEDTTPFLVLPQIIYEDLNPPNGHWQGSIPLFEDTYSGTLQLGNNFNLLNSRPEHAVMNELIQAINFTVRGGGIFYTLEIGPNKSISPPQLMDRLRMERVRYVTAVEFSLTNPGVNIRHSRQEGSESAHESEPQFREFHVAAEDNTSGVLITGNPHIIMRKYSAGGAELTPATTPPSGQVVLDHAGTYGTDGLWHVVALTEMKVCVDVAGVKKQRTCIALVSDVYKSPDDPA